MVFDEGLEVLRLTPNGRLLTRVDGEYVDLGISMQIPADQDVQASVMAAMAKRIADLMTVRHHPV
jgi:hypothetical protein